MSECKAQNDGCLVVIVITLAILCLYSAVANKFKEQRSQLDAISAKLGIEPKPAAKAEKETAPK